MLVSFDQCGLLIPSVPDTLGIVNNSHDESAVSTATPQAGAVGVVDGRAARWQSHREERRRELIKAARKAVHKLGSDSSMEDIASAAGTSKSVFYRYFGDKAGLQQAMGEVVLGQMQRRMQEAAQQAQTPREGLLAMVSAYLQMAESSPNVYAFITRLSPGEASAQDAIAASGALGNFFEQITGMIATPMREYLGDHHESVIVYWPTAAIGLVRNAGEMWLGSPADSAKPDQATMAGQITDWLCLGIAPALKTTT
ncbi:MULTISPECIES: TetR/AcrR family transcriptional regulator [Micrococcaceae]|jgi:AcrR family transcriptional regulator|uniref:TetR/AcrR family transcriptional regulator n=1 Tax=Micrococcaceae TaxID=1268 RepID=UPI001F1D2A1B|nr:MULTISPECIES: TetR/AcrR family transcriptional regulator [Micrococcaceae]MCF3141471.1 TetR/AcrR family transcriptional regulator [Paenarthrobacter sp. AR 02]MCR1160119.1 TetR/AcrR family transcriptional regulator [Paenarthrobacter sp. UW852]